MSLVLSPNSFLVNGSVMNHPWRCDETNSDDSSASTFSFPESQQQCHNRQSIHPVSRGKSLVPTSIPKRKTHPYPRKRRRCLPISKPIKTNFPGKLFSMVQACTQKSPIVSWRTSSKQTTPSLVIWEKDSFLKHPTNSFASLSTFRSFERQLNSWGFKRDHLLEDQLLAEQNSATPDSNKNSSSNKTILTKESLRAFHHPYFQEHRPDLLKHVKRRPPGSGNKQVKESIASSNGTAAMLTAPATMATKTSKKPPTPTAQRSALDTLSSSNEDSEMDSIRTDLVLPSGACLRINRRIPTWAIPAQEAAIQYLFQKHSNGTTKQPTNSHKTKISENTNLHDDKRSKPTEESSLALLDCASRVQQDSQGSLMQSKQNKRISSHERLDSNELLDDDRFEDASEDEVVGIGNGGRFHHGKNHDNDDYDDDDSDDDDCLVI